MSTTEIVTVGVVAAWLLVLTVVILMVVRQIGAMLVRIELVARGGGSSYAHGALVGLRLAEHLVTQHPFLASGRKVVLLVSGTCTTCAGLIDELSSTWTPTYFDARDELVVLVVGADDGRRTAIVEDLHDRAFVVVDPVATDIARNLKLANVPSAIVIDAGVIAASRIFIDRAIQLDEMISGPVPAPDGPPYEGVATAV